MAMVPRGIPSACCVNPQCQGVETRRTMPWCAAAVLRLHSELILVHGSIRMWMLRTATRIGCVDRGTGCMRVTST